MGKKKYDYVGDFNDGVACVKLSDKWGFINGKELKENLISLVGENLVSIVDAKHFN